MTPYSRFQLCTTHRRDFSRRDHALRRELANDFCQCRIHNFKKKPALALEFVEHDRMIVERTAIHALAEILNRWELHLRTTRMVRFILNTHVVLPIRWGIRVRTVEALFIGVLHNLFIYCSAPAVEGLLTRWRIRVAPS